MPIRSLGSALVLLLPLGLVACGGDAQPDPEPPPPDPIERRVEPVRQRAADADSLIRARERAVEELGR